MSPQGDELAAHLHKYVVRLGDNALILGQRLGEWVGRAPELEEELALANFALDYIGQARALYSYAAQLHEQQNGTERTEDHYAYQRDSNDFENLIIVEQPNGDFAHSMLRLYLFEEWYLLQLGALEESQDTHLAALAERFRKEVRYHTDHAQLWVKRLGDGTDESHHRLEVALDHLWRFTAELFAPDETDRHLHAAGLGPDLTALLADWQTSVSETLEAATLNCPKTEPYFALTGGGKQGVHTEHLGYLIAELQFLQRAYPGQTW